MSGSLTTAVMELARYKSDLVGIQEVRQDIVLVQKRVSMMN